jgi:hypothetical protein
VVSLYSRMPWFNLFAPLCSLASSCATNSQYGLGLVTQQGFSSSSYAFPSRTVVLVIKRCVAMNMRMVRMGTFVKWMTAMLYLRVCIQWDSTVVEDL